MPVQDEIPFSDGAGRSVRQSEAPDGEGPHHSRGSARFARLCYVMVFVTVMGCVLWKTDILHLIRITPSTTHQVDLSQMKAIGELRKEAERLQDQRKWPEAVKRLAKLVELAPDDLEIRRQYGLCLVRAGEQRQGITELEHVLRKGREDAVMWHLLGHGYSKVSKNSQALDAFERAISQEPTNYENYRCGARFIAEAAQADANFHRHLPLAARWYGTAVQLGGPQEDLAPLKALLDQHIRNGLLQKDALADLQ